MGYQDERVPVQERDRVMADENDFEDDWEYEAANDVCILHRHLFNNPHLGVTENYTVESITTGIDPSWGIADFEHIIRHRSIARLNPAVLLTIADKTTNGYLKRAFTNVLYYDAPISLIKETLATATLESHPAVPLFYKYGSMYNEFKNKIANHLMLRDYEPIEAMILKMKEAKMPIFFTNSLSLSFRRWACLKPDRKNWDEIATSDMLTDFFTWFPRSGFIAYAMQYRTVDIRVFQNLRKYALAIVKTRRRKNYSAEGWR